MQCRINLRRDQTFRLREKVASSKVTVFAPSWVQDGLLKLGEILDGTTFSVFDPTDRPVSVFRNPPKEEFSISSKFNNQSLVLLERIARNESWNTSGIIDRSLFPGIREDVLLSLKDLVRQCVIVGSEYTSCCGGYRKPIEVQKRQKVYVCDLSALQFQQTYNTGRLVLVQKENNDKGLLDDFIYEKVVGEKRKPTFVDVTNPKNRDKFKNRFIPCKFNRSKFSTDCFLDTKAYTSFVKQDVILAGIAVSKMVKKYDPGKRVNFKFLKYGTGFFAGPFSPLLDTHILPAVVQGIEVLLETNIVREVITSFEFPFYQCDQESSKKLAIFEEKYGVKFVFSNDDALKIRSEEVMTAITNCSDPHAPFGNEMGYSSVDAAIAENLEGKGHIFCPNINIKMTEEYIDLSFEKSIEPMEIQIDADINNSSDGAPKIADEDCATNSRDNERKKLPIDDMNKPVDEGHDNINPKDEGQNTNNNETKSECTVQIKSKC